ncbi:MAG: low molecular weight phosphatase family protein [Clostridia bacterium]|nr:low molecular weight phosphatase family protein [Clostridia bacterium]
MKAMKIVFICTGNTCRSPMAEVIFKHLIQKNHLQDISCTSAGISAKSGQKASRNAIKVCKEWDLDLTKHTAKNIFDIQIEDYDRFVAMNETHLEILKTLGVPGDKICVLGNSIADPFGENLDAYRKCRNEITDSLKKLILDIKNGS